jgi:glutaryl-CoA dehydrogenase
MAHTATSSTRGKEFVPPAVNADFYRISDLLDPAERKVAKRVREFMEVEVAPTIEDYWGVTSFPTRSSQNWRLSMFI